VRTHLRIAAPLVAVSCLVFGGSVSAQQAVADDPDIARIRLQVKNFEMALRNAVEAGAQELGAAASKIIPGSSVSFFSDPVVRGWLIPNIGYDFMVEVPTILPITVAILRTVPAPADRVVPVTPTSPVGVTRPAPPVPGKAVSGDSAPPVAAPVAFDPERVYADKVRDALIDALIDSSKSLLFKESDRLTVIAAPSPAPYANPLEPRRRSLILQIRGADLAAYHRQEITKDEVRRRIVESRF
jgi:hypothetical protein